MFTFFVYFSYGLLEFLSLRQENDFLFLKDYVLFSEKSPMCYLAVCISFNKSCFELSINRVKNIAPQNHDCLFLFQFVPQLQLSL